MACAFKPSTQKAATGEFEASLLLIGTLGQPRLHRALISKQNKKKTEAKHGGIVFNPSTWEYEAGASQVHGLSNLQSEFKGSLESLVRLCLKMKSKKRLNHY